MRLPAWSFVLGGVLAGWIVGGAVPPALREPLPQQREFRLARPVENPLTVTDAQWMFEPLLYGDFDLRMEVELSDGADLDVLLRQVEPRVHGATLLPFQGRFVVLRLSTRGEGTGWRTREQALLGPRGDGVGLAPGLPASVWIEGRGTQLTANVAGKQQPPFAAADRYGMFTLVVRGGTAVVRSLTITDHGVPHAWRWSRWTWTLLGGIGGSLVAWLARARTRSVPWVALAGLAPPLLAWLAVRRADLDLAFPPPASLAMVLLGSLLAPAAALLRGAWALPPLVAATALLLLPARSLRHDITEIDALFGPDAGNQIAEAHAQRVRTATGGLVTLDQRGKRVFLLGGSRLYELGLPEDHLELRLARELEAALRQKVAVPCLPTADGHTAQQWRLFATCYSAFRPAVVVLGIPRDEMAIDERTGGRRSSPAQVQATIDAAAAWTAQHGSKLVVFADSGLPAELRELVQRVAAAGIPVVVAADGASSADLAKQLAKAVLPLLAP